MDKVKLPAWLSSINEKLKGLRADPRFSKMLVVISIVYPLVLIFISREEILSLDWSSFFKVLLTCLLVYYVSMFLQNVVWSLIVDSNLSRFWFNSQAYFKTILMKRLPGGIWHWLGRQSIYEVSFPGENSGVSKANLIEWLILILTGLAGYLLTVSLTVGVPFILLTLGVTTWLLHKDDTPVVKTFSLAIGIVIFYFICWFAGALILHYLLTTAQPDSLIPFKTSFATWCLTSAISMLFFFFPSGSLIRDFSLAALLTNIIGPAKVILVILQVRVIFFVADFFWSFVSLQLIKTLKVRSNTKAN